MIAADAVTIALAYILADILRCTFWQHAEWPEFIPGYGSSVRVHMKVLVFLPFAWPAILFRLGWYDQQRRFWTRDVRDALAGTAITAMLMAALALLLERDVYPRAQIGFAAACLVATTMLGRGITGWVRRWYGSRRPRHVLIVGTSRDAVRLRRLLRSAALDRPQVVGHLRGPWETDAASIETGAIIGDIDQLGPILDGRVVDEVLFCTPIEHLADVLPHVQLCEEVGVTSHVQAESMACHSTPEIVDFHGVPLLAYSPARHSPELLTIKRAADAILAIIGIILTAPIMLICAIVIKLTSPGPILFRQLRSGLNGRTFHMFKFRTMGSDAEARRKEVAHLDTSPGPTFKAAADPRVTAIGRVLRRWSLDELPQLFNVIRGDMAIVGPRPPIPEEVEQYDRWQRRRLSMRPGLTCLWQIKGRHHIGFQEWMQLDLFYIDHWSLRLDFLILCKTVSIVLGGTGA